MRKVFTLLIFSVLVFFGCNQESEITSPVNNLPKEPNWILLPEIEGIHIENSFTVSERINGAQGGIITMNESYTGGPFGNVIIEAELIFTQGAFPGNKYISITVDDVECVSDFAPSFDKFNRLVTYSITYTGIDLSNIDPENVKFAYIGTNGELQYAQYEQLNVNVYTGTIQLVNAEILHFSRYGFVN